MFMSANCTGSILGMYLGPSFPRDGKIVIRPLISVCVRAKYPNLTFPFGVFNADFFSEKECILQFKRIVVPF